MTEHEVKTVLIHDKSEFKGVEVEFDAVYEYCDKADEYYEVDDAITQNDINLKDAYRRAMGLMTSDQIIGMRKKYNISQSDLCTLLGWGEKTITRYEGHQVQDFAHDTIMRKLNDDPVWFLELLNQAKELISDKAFEKSLNAGNRLVLEDISRSSAIKLLQRIADGMNAKLKVEFIPKA